jgi:hypothetical protein
MYQIIYSSISRTYLNEKKNCPLAISETHNLLSGAYQGILIIMVKAAAPARHIAPARHTALGAGRSSPAEKAPLVFLFMKFGPDIFMFGSL